MPPSETLKVIVVDDEPLALNLMTSILNGITGVDIVAMCANGRKALAAIDKLRPDLVFLDIQMPGLNGFDVVKSLQADAMPLIVFATAYDEFALDAFDVHAVDYLLKPFEKARVERAVERARQRLLRSEQSRKQPLLGAINDIARKIDKRIDGTHHAAANRGDEGAGFADGKLVLKDGSDVSLVDHNSVDWIDAAGDYMCVHVGEDTHIVRTTLKKLMEELDKNLFIRIHRSTVVNVKRIEKISPLPKGERIVHLENGHSLKVSRNYKSALEAYIGHK